MEAQAPRIAGAVEHAYNDGLGWGYAAGSLTAFKRA
jgi:hypothetical protein